ncbi:MAG: hypothetical protein JKX82_16270 [Oleispira sp.]|nr:hypothetical protein [Oleispira sp.]
MYLVPLAFLLTACGGSDSTDASDASDASDATDLLTDAAGVTTYSGIFTAIK